MVEAQAVTWEDETSQDPVDARDEEPREHQKAFQKVFHWGRAEDGGGYGREEEEEELEGTSVAHEGDKGTHGGRSGRRRMV